VVHLAGYFDFSGEPNPLYHEVNVEGTRRLLQHLQGLQVEQFIYASTMLVHAPTEPGVAISETSPMAPKWAYPQSKRDTEQVVEQQHGAIPYVLLRVAGVYTERILPPTLAQQTRWIYERQFNSRVFPGDISHGQSFLHIDDLIDGLQRLIARRAALPPELALLLGEPASLSYEALQNQMGMLIHGEPWDTDTLPKPLAKLGARLRQKMEPVVPDAIDFGETPFVKPFMVELAADHYELDISRARQLLGWEPRHALRDMLPNIVERLRGGAAGLVSRQQDHPAGMAGNPGRTPHPPTACWKTTTRELRQQHRDSLWAHFLNMGVGAWLLPARRFSATATGADCQRYASPAFW
jgi:nucleoside-diphosphate-sugar epimerase